MKKLIYLASVFLSTLAFSQVGINTDEPNSNASFHVSERMKTANSNPDIYSGTMIQRYTTFERDNNLNPLLSQTDQGLTVFNKTTGCYNVWNWSSTSSSGSWAELCGSKQGMVRFNDCSKIKVVGGYILGKPLSEQTVHIDIPVFVTELGSYSYTTNEVNGIVFSAYGNFVNTGNQTIRLMPTSINGTPNDGVHNYTVTISPTTDGSSGITCSNIPVKFIDRSQSTMYIVAVAGTNATTLTSGTNSSGLVYRWLTNTDNVIAANEIAKYYSGTEEIVIKSVGANKLVELEEALQNASGIIVGANQDLSYGFANMIKDWNASTGGFVINYCDKIRESGLADVLGFYVEDGSAVNGTIFNTAQLQDIFGPDQPFPISDGLNIGRDGSASGQISTSLGTNFIDVGGRKGGIVDLDRKIVIFGDKFGNGSATSAGPKQNFARVLADFFAYFMKEAPVY